MEGEGWKEPWTGSVPELKEKRIVGEINWDCVDTDTRMGKGKDVVGTKDQSFPVFISSHSEKCCSHS